MKNGKAQRVKGSLEGLRQISGREFAIYCSAFDNMKTDGIWMGHIWKPYYLKWTGKRFQEYRAKIHINLRRMENGGTSYENVNLAVRGRNVSLMIANRLGSDIVEKSSHGGIYCRASKRF